MQFTDDDIHEFADIWEREFHERLSNDAARRHASLLLDLYMELYLSRRAKRLQNNDP
jgi:hypothetical protein